MLITNFGVYVMYLDLS